jgi:hypothetical protein
MAPHGLTQLRWLGRGRAARRASASLNYVKTLYISDICDIIHHVSPHPHIHEEKCARDRLTAAAAHGAPGVRVAGTVAGMFTADIGQPGGSAWRSRKACVSPLTARRGRSSAGPCGCAA